LAGSAIREKNAVTGVHTLWARLARGIRTWVSIKVSLPAPFLFHHPIIVPHT
jgi:hypothetical protein